MGSMTKKTEITHVHVTFIPCDLQIGMLKYKEIETTFRIFYVHPNKSRGDDNLKSFIGVS